MLLVVRVEALIGELANAKEDIDKTPTLILPKTGSALSSSCFLLVAPLKLQPIANELLGTAILPLFDI